MLETSKLCNGFEMEEVLAFEALTARHRKDDGDTVLEAGAANASIFVVRSGSVRVDVIDGARTTSLAELGPGEVFGEMSFLDHGPTSARVTAVGETELLELSHDALDDVLDDHPILWGKLWRNVAVILKERLARLSEVVARAIDPAEHGAMDPYGRP